MRAPPFSIKVTSLLVTLIALVLLAGGVIYFKAAQRFDAIVWKEWSVATHDYAPNNPRGRMVKDLLTNHLPLGLQREEILLLLGKADEADERNLRYYLGGYSGSAFLPGYDYLELLIDTDGKLVERLIRKSG